MIKKIAFVIILMFALVGAFVTSTVFHELSHYNDFKDISENPEICALNIPTQINSFKDLNVGYYKFTHSSENQEIYEQKLKYTELKSHSLDLAVNLILAVCLIILIKK
ncbi:MAG: hypothetical protein U9Q06_00375 [Nanoarchaeota archaeon]|nr:hypothetical protein [Nanoarchaeota archaeon]